MPFVNFTKGELSQGEGEFPGSDFVKKTVGVDNVCERSAMAGGKKRLIMKKTAREGMTLALAEENWRCEF